MRLRNAAFGVAAAILVWGCDNLSAPKWNADVYFPIRYPDVQLSQYGAAVPPTTVTFTSPVDSQTVSDATREIFDRDIDTLRAEVVVATSTNITGTLDISITNNRAFLFSSLPSQAATLSVPIRVTAGDTTRFTVNTVLFRSAQKLYTQSRATMRSTTGGLVPLTSADKLSVGVNLTASMRVSQ